MGKNLIHYATSYSDVSIFYHELSAVEDEALLYIQQAKKLALETLQKEKKLLLVLSNYLSEHPMIKKEVLEKIIKEYVVSPTFDLTDSRFYRDKLRSQLETNKILNEITYSNPIKMNKLT